MEAIEFVNHYPDYIRQLEAVVKPEYRNTIKKLKELDPHSIVKPEHYFNTELEALGAVYQLFLRQLSPNQAKTPKQKKQFSREQDIEAAKELLAANGIQSQGLWGVDDIMGKAKEMKKRCSKKDARIILCDIEQNFDAEYGISWQTLENQIDDYFRDRKSKDK
jgi:hypothetical protein